MLVFALHCLGFLTTALQTNGASTCTLLPEVVRLLDHPENIVQQAASWALGRLVAGCLQHNLSFLLEKLSNLQVDSQVYYYFDMV